MKKRPFPPALIAGAVVLPGLLLATATVRETVVEMPTYPFGDPDPVPRPAPEGDCIWPYFKFERYSASPVPHRWKRIVLENDAVSVEVFPEIGGKIWGATDKATGRGFLYRNSAVKFRNLAMRGPWTSGGVEFNFGLIGHAPTVATPVDYQIRTNRDGSASCFVGALELLTRTRWCVEIRLGAADRFFTTDVTWFNGSNLDQPCYQWMNAAYPAGGQYFINGDAWIGHDGKPFSWPIDETGRDISFYANNNFGGAKSCHILRGDSGTSGIWWEKEKFGSLYQAEPYDRLGRKLFIWALSRSGEIWKSLLTDTDGQYVEMQAGRYFNQPAPGSYLTPFKLAGFSAGGTIAFTGKWSPVTSRSGFPPDALPKTENAARPLSPPPDFNWGALYGRTLYAEQMANIKRFDLAEPKLRSVLEEDPCFLPALVCLGDCLAHRNRRDEAIGRLRKVLAIDAYHGKANYVCGLLYAERGDRVNALDCLCAAATSAEFRAPALAQIAALHAASGEYRRALAAADRALLANPLHLYAGHLRLIALRKLRDAAAHAAACAEMLRRFPLYHAARYEKDPETFARGIRCELPHQELLELAFNYARAGQFTDAAEIARRGENMLNRIAAAYFLHRSGDAAGAERALRLALARPAAYAFPFRRETGGVLEWARANSPAWQIRYLQALLLRSFGEKASAAKEMDALRGEDLPAEALLFRASLHTGGQARADILLAQEKGDNRHAPRELYKRLADENRRAEALSVIERICRDFPEDFDAGIHLAETQVILGRYGDALKTLSSLAILPSEASSLLGGTRKLYREACLGQAAAALRKGDAAAAREAVARSMVWDESLGIGKPYDTEIDLRLENWILLQTASGKEKRGLREKIAAGFHPEYKSKFYPADLLTALVLRETGFRKQADAVVGGFGKSAAADWCREIYKGNLSAEPAAGARKDSDVRLLRLLFPKALPRGLSAEKAMGSGAAP